MKKVLENTKICRICNIEKPIDSFLKRHNRNSYRLECKVCLNLKLKEYRKTYYKKFPWKKTLHGIKQRCNNQKDQHYKNYGGRGIECRITADELKELWFRDKAYLMKKPSIDRKDNDGHYEFDNCRYIELEENSAKNKRKPILQFDKEGNFIKEWESLTEASKELNINISNICSHIRGNKKYNHVGGFIWRYK